MFVLLFIIFQAGCLSGLGPSTITDTSRLVEIQALLKEINSGGQLSWAASLFKTNLRKAQVSIAKMKRSKEADKVNSSSFSLESCHLVDLAISCMAAWSFPMPSLA